MNSSKLFILTPLSKKDRFSLADEGAVDIGDLIVDLSGFPHVVWEIGPNRAYTDITDKLLRIPDYWAVAEDWLSQMTKRTGLQDKLQIDGYGFWWTLNSLKFEPGVSDFANCFAWVDLLDAIKTQIKVGNIIVRGRHDAIVDIVHQIFKKGDVEVVHEKGDPTKKKKARRSRSGLRLFRILLGIVFVIYASFRRPCICFVSSTNLLRTKTSGGKRKLQDVYFGEVDAAIRQRGWRIAYIEHYGTNASWRGILARRFFFPTELIGRIGSLLVRSIGHFRRVVGMWEGRWFGFQKSLHFFMTYKGYDLATLLMPLIRKQFMILAPTIEIHVKLWRAIFGRWKPKILYINNSYGSLTLPAIVAAKSLDIITIEQQHGIIGKNHKAYLVPRGLSESAKVPRCDYMLLWGDYAKRLLINSGAYTDLQLGVCGFPRIDLLKREMTPRSVTLAALGIPVQAQIVLYTSNVIVQHLYLKILDSVEEGRASSVYWIIKLHPGEKTRPLWQDAIQRRHLGQVRVVQEEVDFYELLAVCDVHISSVSTTIIEAAVFGKLNIGLDVAYIPDPVGYEESGAYLAVAPDRLGKTVLTLLRDTSRKDKLLQLQKLFASDWCRNDGAAAECIVKFIEDKFRMQKERLGQEFPKARGLTSPCL